MNPLFQKIGGSVAGVIIGLVLFLTSLGIFFWNEGRLNEADLARRAEPFDGSEVQEVEKNKLVAITGETGLDESLSDGLYLIPGDYLAVRRTVEMYSWTEETTTEGEKKIYYYEKEWTENPEDSSEFNQPAEHQNPVQKTKSETLINDSSRVGKYYFEAKNTGLTGYKDLSLNESNINLVAENTDSLEQEIVAEDSLDANSEENNSLEDKESIEQNIIFQGKGSVANPEIGDLRISYQVVRQGKTATVFGKVEDNRVLPYRYNDNDLFYTLKEGTYDQAINSLNSDYRASLWAFRIIGFILLWISLLLILSPVKEVLNFIPVLGTIAKSFFPVFTFIIAGLIAVVTIILSIIIHNILLLIFILLLGGGLVGALLYYQKHIATKNKGQSPTDKSQIPNGQKSLEEQKQVDEKSPETQNQNDSNPDSQETIKND